MDGGQRWHKGRTWECDASEVPSPGETEGGVLNCRMTEAQREAHGVTGLQHVNQYWSGGSRGFLEWAIPRLGLEG